MTDDARRQTILDCAARLFRHYGPSKTTMADIAREAAVGVGTVYLVFPSKEAILEQLSKGAYEQVLDGMQKAADEHASTPFPERFLAVLEARLAAFQKLQTEGQHACELVHCKAPASKAAQERFRRDEQTLFAELLDDAFHAGETAPLDSGRTAPLLQRALATLSPPWLFEEPAEHALAATRQMAQLLMTGLAARPGDRDAPTAKKSSSSTAARSAARTSAKTRKRAR